MKFFKISFVGVAFSLVTTSTFAQQSAPSHQAYIFDNIEKKIEKIPLYLNGNVCIYKQEVRLV